MKLLELAKELGIAIVIAHYPSYSSKYNPIEHKLFCHVHSAIKGIVFSNYTIVKELMEKTSTTKGLSVIVRLNLNQYEKGLYVDKLQIDNSRICYNQTIPQLSYWVLP